MGTMSDDKLEASGLEALLALESRGKGRRKDA